MTHDVLIRALDRRDGTFCKNNVRCIISFNVLPSLNWLNRSFPNISCTTCKPALIIHSIFSEHEEQRNYTQNRANWHLQIFTEIISYNTPGIYVIVSTFSPRKAKSQTAIEERRNVYYRLGLAGKAWLTGYKRALMGTSKTAAADSGQWSAGD